MFCWIPESPYHGGLYAADPAKRDLGDLCNATRNAHMALQFTSKEECQKWCGSNPEPIFVPVEHGFA